MSRSLPLSLVLGLSLVGGPLPVRALDPLELERQKPPVPQDPDRFTRPETEGGLKGPDIREHRDKINAVKKQIFKSGEVPGGALFQAAPPPPNGEGVRYRAAAPMDQFTPQVQAQISERLPAAAGTVAIEVLVEEAGVRVESAVVPPISTPVIAGAPSPTAPGVPKVRPAPLSVPAVRSAPVTVPPVPAVLNGTRAPVPQASPTAAEPAPSSVITPVSSRDRTQTQSVDVVKTITGQNVEIVSEDAAPVSAAASVFLIPLRDAPALTVRLLPSNDTIAPTRVAIEGQVRFLPPLLRDQLSTGNAASGSRFTSDTFVRLETVVQSDGALRVESITRIPAPSQPAISGAVTDAPATRAVPVSPVPAQDSAPIPTTPGVITVDVAAPVTTPAAPQKPVVPVAVADVARALRISPELIQVPASERPHQRQFQMTLSPSGLIVRAETTLMAGPGGTSLERVQVELPLTAMSPAVREEMEVRLADAGVSIGWNNEQATLEMTQPGEGAPFRLTGIRIEQDSKKILIWGEREIRSAPESPAAASQAPSAPVPPSVTPPSSPRQAALRTVSGLASSLYRVAKTATGKEPKSITLATLNSPAVAVVQDEKGKEAQREFTWTPASREGAFEFISEGRGLDFDDEIREKIYAELREAVKQGDAWAARAVKGLEKLHVVFEVDETQDGEPEIRVAGVSPVTEDAILLQADEMGLGVDDYVTVNVAGRTILALNSGKSATLRVGNQRMKLVSPDGNVRIFVRTGRDWNRAGALMLMSRKSLIANRNGLSVLAPGGASAVREALMMPDDGQPYLVRLSEEGAGIIIRRAEPAEPASIQRPIDTPTP